MLKIGIQTAGLLNHRGIDGTFDLLSRCGFDFVDFSMTALDAGLGELRQKPDPLTSLFDRPLEDIYPALAPYEQAASRWGVAFGQAHAPYPSWWPGNDARNDYMIMLYRKMIALCGHMGCPYLIIHPAKQRLMEEDWRANMDLYTPLIPDLKAYGVTCCLENVYLTGAVKHLESSCADPYEACDYIDELNDIAGEKRFAFCLDTGHALLTGRDIYSTIMKLGNRIEALHIHDNDGARDLHGLPYSGLMDWERFIRGLAEIGYAGGLSFETVTAVKTFDPDLHEELLRLIAATGRLFSRRIAQASAAQEAI